MMPFALTLGLLVVGVLLLFVYFPIGLPLLLLGLLRRPSRSCARERREVDRHAGAHEAREPTGEVRPPSGGPDTANERQGQI
jgi:hypothetical protein